MDQANEDKQTAIDMNVKLYEQISTLKEQIEDAQGEIYNLKEQLSQVRKELETERAQSEKSSKAFKAESIQLTEMLT